MWLLSVSCRACLREWAGCDFSPSACIFITHPEGIANLFLCSLAGVIWLRVCCRKQVILKTRWLPFSDRLNCESGRSACRTGYFQEYFVCDGPSVGCPFWQNPVLLIRGFFQES